MSSTKEQKIYIIGAGISGLIAALNLEKAGFHPIMLEKDKAVGGRVQTDQVDGFLLDRGFQVLLEAYPKAQEYLDYDNLELQPLSSGAVLFSNGKGEYFGDPLRESKFLFPTITSSAGSLSDKWKIFRLNRSLQGKDLDAVFEHREQTTLDYLKDYGFSDKIIHSFFRPFFSGIYLEPNLDTSSRMFEYVYKLFGKGRAMIPKGGIGAISDQLKSKLLNTEIRLSCTVDKVESGMITLSNGEQLKSDFTIIASNPGTLLANYASTLLWKSCDNLYFKTPTRTIKDPVIGLSKHEDSFVNNIFYPTSVATTEKGNEELLSVTVVKKHELSPEALIEQVTQELQSIFGISGIEFLKHYPISMALPNLQDLQYNRESRESLLTEHIAIAGDHQLNGSLNAAMISGENAATAALTAINKELIPMS
ncbi:MAG: NAD(P)/FAD-dependent oxidoreductase [Cytophagales bacterium]|nr:NAD(P)/FAD-dependent oxidoreductase [Cytophagales bacterium]